MRIIRRGAAAASRNPAACGCAAAGSCGKGVSVIGLALRQAVEEPLGYLTLLLCLGSGKGGLQPFSAPRQPQPRAPKAALTLCFIE
ncbi:hypothetical protein LA76x_1067 [Lysobacter antibioticus]|uniref:Uncharacterized protein n=1 Tax=Lysobacter antibioticus TaxID=84531 RepID=A0A0S2F6S4_LYSAN|nr:hypothetical protein LA76x_1067 [Lysobacter antibioticus]